MGLPAEDVDQGDKYHASLHLPVHEMTLAGGRGIDSTTMKTVESKVHCALVGSLQERMQGYM
jgi:hypothetical protein